MLNKSLLVFCLLCLSCFYAYSQAFDRIGNLVKERAALQAAYDKINAQVKAAKSKKPSLELQDALDKLLAKDVEIVNEIDVVESDVNFQQKELAARKEKVKLVGRVDKSQSLLIDSLLNSIAILHAQKDSLLSGTISFSSYQESLKNELKNTTDEKTLIQKELDDVKTDKFILARRNKILLYFNMGVGVLLLIGLIFMLLSLRKPKKTFGTVSVQDLTPHKPRPITGFNQAIPKIAFEAFDTRLDKIEKLGKLREKGLLSEEEFQVQKKQILSSKNDG